MNLVCKFFRSMYNSSFSLIWSFTSVPDDNFRKGKVLRPVEKNYKYSG